MKRILVAHDGSPLSAHVLEEALAIAKAYGASIRLVRVVANPVPPMVPVPSATLPIAPVNLDALVMADTSSLREVAHAIPRPFFDGLTIDIGAPWRAVLAAARSYEAELIVIGAHAHGSLRRLLGTTAARIVERATVPVVVVRPRPPMRGARLGSEPSAVARGTTDAVSAESTKEGAMSSEGTNDSSWGHCSHCKFFETPARVPLEGEEAACGESTLAKYQLRVVGVGGCNRFALRPGLMETVEQPGLYV